MLVNNFIELLSNSGFSGFFFHELLHIQPQEKLLLLISEGLDLIDGNNRILQILIVVLITGIFIYSARILYDRIIRK